MPLPCPRLSVAKAPPPEPSRLWGGLPDNVLWRMRQRSWETPEGEQRSMTEIEADEVGAGLKWATAKVERASQRGNGERAPGRERQAERGRDFNGPPPTY
jgi:hypothetical protein